MKRNETHIVMGHRLPPPRVTPWAPFLLACALSLPVLMAMAIGWML